MKIIISPAKNMLEARDDLLGITTPIFLNEANVLFKNLKNKDFNELKKIYKSSDDIVEQNLERLKNTDLVSDLSPAILTFNGIAFKHMKPSVFTDKEFEYVQSNLRILSGLYGLLRPLDGIQSYRLEMASKLSIDDKKDLYEYWGRKIYKEIIKDDNLIINLASKEYSKCIEDFLETNIKMINIHFFEEYKGKLVCKATVAKMARGEMVRYMAENSILDIESIKNFNYLGYKYRDDLSNENNFYFERVVDEKDIRS